MEVIFKNSLIKRSTAEELVKTINWLLYGVTDLLKKIEIILKGIYQSPSTSYFSYGISHDLTKGYLNLSLQK